MSNEKPIALKILNDDCFLSHFRLEKFASFQLLEWEPEMGEKHCLHNVLPFHIDFLFVDSQQAYTLDNLICWARVLKTNGILALESRTDCTLEEVCQWLDALAKPMPNPNPNVWMFSKTMPKLEYIDYAVQVSQLIVEEKWTQALSVSEQMNAYFPHIVNAINIQTKILRRLGLSDKTDALWDRFIKRSPSSQNHIFKALDTILSGRYYEGFKARADCNLPHLRRTKCLPTPDIEAKRWKGEDLYNKTLVIWSEFGLGDEIMFSQLAYYLRSLGTKKNYFAYPIAYCLSA